MNLKQLISMWCGIAAIVLFAFYMVIGVSSYQADYAKFAVGMFLIALVTAGLIYTFKDGKTRND